MYHMSVRSIGDNADPSLVERETRFDSGDSMRHDTGPPIYARVRDHIAQSESDVVLGGVAASALRASRSRAQGPPTLGERARLQVAAGAVARQLSDGRAGRAPVPDVFVAAR